MNALIFYGLVIMVGLAAVRALFPAQAPQRQVIYVVAEPAQPAQGGFGCLPLIIAGVVVVVALRLLGAA
jgi:hypothetical protein